MTAEQDWDARYGQAEQIFSGRPNDALLARVDELAPGRALDLGCGEGGDAVWLAEQGWQVTAVDVSTEALTRASRAARARQVADRIGFEQHDLAASFPDGEFDLISAQFLHSLGEFPREQVLRTAAGRVTAGGVLLIEGHADIPSWAGDFGEVDLPSSRELLDRLALGDTWQVLVCEEHERDQHGPDGTHLGARTDTTLMLRRSTPRR